MNDTNTETNQTNMDTNQTPTPAVTPATPVATPVVAATPAVAPVVAATPAVAPAPAKKADTLKIPAGKFTHTELAQLNGKTNQQVWTRYQAMVKGKIILSAGTRPPKNGRGKPSLLWELNPNPPVQTDVVVATAPIATAASPAVTPAQPAVAPTEPTIEAAGETVVLPTEAQQEAAADANTNPAPENKGNDGNEPPAGGTPAGDAPTAQTADTATVTVEVARVEPTPEPTPAPAPAETPAEPVADTCPACQHQLVAHNDATGVMVGCYQPKSICPTAEHPEGHGSTIAKALDALHDKWDHLVNKLNPAPAVS